MKGMKPPCITFGSGVPTFCYVNEEVYEVMLKKWDQPERERVACSLRRQGVPSRFLQARRLEICFVLYRREGH